MAKICLDVEKKGFHIGNVPTHFTFPESEKQLAPLCEAKVWSNFLF